MFWNRKTRIDCLRRTNRYQAARIKLLEAEIRGLRTSLYRSYEKTFNKADKKQIVILKKKMDRMRLRVYRLEQAQEKGGE